MGTAAATTITVVAALIAGACFAVGGVLQQRAASAQPQSDSLSFRLVYRLAHDRGWLYGIAATAGSYVFKAVALAFGPLTVVQPLVASELVFAIPPSVRRHGEHLGLREWAGIGAVTVGLVVGLVSADPATGNPLPPTWKWVVALALVAVVTVAALLVSRRVSGPTRASFVALAAVATLVAQSALMAATVALFKMGLHAVFTSWQPYFMALLALVSVTLTESAYQAGPLAASMPVMDAANPVLASVLGVVVFDETIATGTWNLVGTAVGLALLVGGVILVDTSPLVRRIQREEAQHRR